VSLALISQRWFPVAFLPLLALCRLPQIRRESTKQHTLRAATICIGLCLLPFLLSFLRGDRPFERVFLNLVVPFSLLVALSAKLGLGSLAKSRTVIVALIIACESCSLWALHKRDQRLLENLERGPKTHSLFMSYYQFRFQPRRLLDLWEERTDLHSIPLVLAKVDPEVMPAYLGAREIHHQSSDRIEELIQSEDRLAILTERPSLIAERIEAQRPDYRCQRENHEVAFFNLLRCQSVEFIHSRQ
jgi:hypothetical protein